MTFGGLDEAIRDEANQVNNKKSHIHGWNRVELQPESLGMVSALQNVEDV